LTEYLIFGLNMDIGSFLISEGESIRGALLKLNKLKSDLNLFVVDPDRRLLGSVTDGDIRRGIVNGATLEDDVAGVMNKHCKRLDVGRIDLRLVAEQRSKAIKILPIVDASHHVVDLLNFSVTNTLLPVDAVIMAGGMGIRLQPLTQRVPKPLLLVGDKPIMAYTIDRLAKFGVRNVYVTVNYLKEQVHEFVKGYYVPYGEVRCVTEPRPLGTFGAITLISEWSNDYILLTNSDLLTNIDYENFFLEFLRADCDMMVATIPYPVKVPYAVVETSGQFIQSFVEKPEYMFYANAGIYLFKRSLLDHVPVNEFFNTTDLMELLLGMGAKLAYYPMINYWLDIGSHEDFKKAQEDIKHLKF
jgi:dTDP-glucose pyrophosphorylase